MTFDEVYKAIKRGDVNSLRVALDDGLDPNQSNKYSWTILMSAAMRGKTSVGQLLIDHGADLNQRNRDRDTALSLAASTGHSSFVSLLLRNGASLECYPFGRSLDDYLDWVEKYCRHSKEQMRNIRQQFDAARNAEADQPIG